MARTRCTTRCRLPRASNGRWLWRAACEDPIGTTEVYGEDDGVVRMLVTEHAIAVLLAGQVTRTLTVLLLSCTAGVTAVRLAAISLGSCGY
ncbi:hypothetical protein STRCI_008388 [Streptomyces cinnabarinus]|uniref:Uncharacterized protein n=1 Tax=Streptomyces cinnabarinus TaxID=67287 RepID=A0ABY7KTM2_9ACTN|nr:hypothetical protein [Streptomyces cinnabarinus]WAZ26757.1 hypothetical protein STRCI_008388 [Streptomyces cinnabarinus]